MREVLNKELLTKLYVLDKRTDREIAGILNVHRASVTVARKRHGIKKIREYERKNLSDLSDVQTSLIDGSILGDGAIERNHSSSYVFSFGHSQKQHSYAKMKAKILGDYFSNVRIDKKGMMCVRSIVHPVFGEYRKECYINIDGKWHKRMPKSLLDRLNLYSLSVWYCDDGCQSGNQVWFCVGCPVEEDRENAISVIEDKFGLSCSIHKMSREECWRLCVLKRSQEKFFDIVSGFVSIAIPYKIPNWYQVRHDNQQPSLFGNEKVGSTTGGSLNSDKEHGDNTRLDWETNQGTPGACMMKQVKIQSEQQLILGSC